MTDEKFFTWRGKPSTELSKDELIDICIYLEKSKRWAAQEALNDLKFISQVDKARATMRDREIKSPFTLTTLLAYVVGFLLGIATN